MDFPKVQSLAPERYLSELGRRAVREEAENSKPSIWESFRRLTWAQAIVRIVAGLFLQPCANRWQAAQDISSLRPRDKRFSPSAKPLWQNGPPAKEKVYLGTRERSALRDDLYRQVRESAKKYGRAPVISDPPSLSSSHQATISALQSEIQTPEFQPALQAVFSDETAAHLKELVQQELSVGVGDLAFSVRYLKNDPQDSDRTQLESFPGGASINPEVVLEIDFRAPITSLGESYRHPHLDTMAEGAASGKLVLRLAHDGKATNIRVISLDAQKELQPPCGATKSEKDQSIEAPAEVPSSFDEKLQALGLCEAQVSGPKEPCPFYQVLSHYIMVQNPQPDNPALELKGELFEKISSYANTKRGKAVDWPREIEGRLKYFQGLQRENSKTTLLAPDDGLEYMLDARMLSVIANCSIVVFYPGCGGPLKAVCYKPDFSVSFPDTKEELLSEDSSGRPPIVLSFQPDRASRSGARWAVLQLADEGGLNKDGAADR